MRSTLLWYYFLFYYAVQGGSVLFFASLGAINMSECGKVVLNFEFADEIPKCYFNKSYKLLHVHMVSTIDFPITKRL